MTNSSQKSILNVSSLILILTATVVLVSRVLFLDFPAGNDESMYFLLGHETLKGNIPYSSFYEMKPPFLFYNYAYIVFLFGYTVKGLHLGALFISILNTGLMYALCLKLFSRQKAILASVFFWVLISLPILNGMYLLGEHFVLFYLQGALFFIASRDENEVFRLLTAGALTAIAALTKQTAVFFIPALIYLLRMNKEGIVFSKKLIWTGAGGILLLFLNILVLYFTGSLNDAFYWIISHGKAYSSPTGMSEAITNFTFFFSQFFKTCWLPILLTIGGLVSLFINKKSETLILVLLLLGGAFLGLLPGLRFYSQYWILLIPAMCLSVIWVSDLKPNLPWINFLVPAILFFFLMSQNKTYFPKNHYAYADSLFGGQYFSKTALLSSKLDRILTKNDKLMVMGGLPQAYLYTSKDPLSRHVWAPMISFTSSQCEVFRQELISDFENTKPDYVLFSYNPYHWTLSNGKSDEIYNYAFRQVRANYDKIMAIDLDNSQMYYQDNIAGFGEKANSIFVYKRR
jgi:hypothetical protein